MLDQPDTRDTDDDEEVPEFDHLDEDTPDLPPRESAAQALARVMFEAALTRRNRRALGRQPGLIVVKVPNAGWAAIIGQGSVTWSGHRPSAP